MRLVALGLLLAISVTAAAVAWPRDHAGAPHSFRIVADRAGTGQTKIVWRDGKAPIEIGYVASHLVSPDGRLAAFSGDFPDRRLPVVDLVERRILFRARVAPRALTGCYARPLLWARGGRLVARGSCGDVHRTAASTLAVIDTRRRRTISLRSIGLVMGIARGHGRTVLLTSPRLGPVIPGTYAREERLGPARLIRIGKDASVAEVVLRINAGLANSRTYNQMPGLAIRGDRAVVVAEGEGAAEINLRSLRVSYHRVPFPPRPRRLAPLRRHEGTTNPSRDLQRVAHWIDDRYLAVAGSDTWTRDSFDQTLPAGLRILDTRDWTTKLVDPNASEARVASGIVLAWAPGETGLRGYGRSGRRRFHLFRGREVFVRKVAHEKAIVSVSQGGRESWQRYSVTLPFGRIRHLAW